LKTHKKAPYKLGFIVVSVQTYRVLKLLYML